MTNEATRFLVKARKLLKQAEFVASVGENDAAGHGRRANPMRKQGGNLRDCDPSVDDVTVEQAAI